MPKIGRIIHPPEELVCVAARNDYRDEGVLDYTFAEIMDAASLAYTHLGDIMDERGLSTQDPETVHEFLYSPRLRLEAKKRTLLSHLMGGGHWGPFEHPACTIAIEGISRTAMAQLRTHRHFTFDVMSLRYVRVDTGELLATLDFEDDPKPLEHLFEYPEEFTADEVVSREGVEQIEVSAETRLRVVHDAYATSADGYAQLAEWGVPQEEARKLLPMATKVNMVVSGNARAWMHLVNIRGKANVQGEAREIVDGVFDELREWMPFTFAEYDEMLPLRLTP